MLPVKDKVNRIVILIIVVLGLLIGGLKKCKDSRQNYPQRSVTSDAGDWRHHKLIYTSHARCRMECREITEGEVEFVLGNGILNEAKSREENEEAAGHCPTYALEGKTNDGQQVRIIFGACDKITKVITVIDLGKDHECNCR